MGMSVDIHIYDYFELIKDISRLVEEDGGAPEGRSIHDFVENILPEFGILAGGKYITLWNEYCSESGYNSASELFRAVELYFGLEGVFLSGYDFFDHANAREVLEELNIEPLG